MRDGAIRRCVKWAARVRFAADLGLNRALRRRREVWFELGGECRRCARCCEAPSIRSNAVVWHLRPLRHLFLWWQRAVNGFELVTTLRSERVFVFRCTHFDEATRSCDSYGSRPGMCRDYPRALLYQPEPELLDGCGYRPVVPNSARFLKVLDRYPLTSEQKTRLVRDLRLK